VTDDPASLKASLVRWAEGQGFVRCRVARCHPPRHGEEFVRWLAEGRAGEMEWLGRTMEKRLDPEIVLPGARSVVVVAMNYWQGERTVAEAPASGRVARYAWGEDYHELMRGRLAVLEAFLAEQGGTQRGYVDTGPVLERDFAAEAGIGWHGKNTMLIDARQGLWILLGVILTTLDLEPDAPQAERCGRCVRCLEACPTGALPAPHVLDARRCISYLTIELKGAIPEELRPLIGDRIFGCDACLEVCPWNRFARASREAAFALHPALAERPLRAWLSVSETEFAELFRRSPVRRSKRRGFLRNVCVALGNAGTEADLPELERVAADEEALVAGHARWAVEEIRRRHGLG
jgi:epoxyqueuosine reductase